jgi:bacterioferritin (cytochrome b1)
MAHSTEDQMAKQMYNNMKADIERHISFLEDRLEYLNLSNQLNQKVK